MLSVIFMHTYFISFFSTYVSMKSVLFSAFHPLHMSIASVHFHIWIFFYSSADAGLVWRYANFILDRNASEGVRVFMETQAQLDPSKVLQTLQRYPQARLTFLHHLIDTKNLQVRATCLLIHCRKIMTINE